MKDMFYNYDHHINKKEYPKPLFEPECPKMLSSDSSVVLVKDAKGNELGVQVKHNNAFSLYFSFLNCNCRDDLFAVMTESKFLFEILTTQHEVIISKELPSSECYFKAYSAAMINVSTEESKKLEIDSYRMRLTMIWPGGSYELYPEEVGFLIVR